jgi:zinc transporter ZupT
MGDRAVRIANDKKAIALFSSGGLPVTFDDDAADGFVRLHKVFTFHLGVAVGLAWMTALYASLYAPWVHNIRPLIDPTSVGRVESTWSFLFGMPSVLTVAWIVAFAGRDMLRHFRMLKNQTVEFALAGAAAFMIFYLSIDRAVAAILLGS